MNDHTEFETKVQGIIPEEIIAKLRAIGAKETPEFLAKRFVYDFSDENVKWIRLRQSGNKCTMTYKLKPKRNTIVGKTVEIEVEVSDFDKTAEILSKLTFKKVFYQESKSHIFTVGDIEFSIDTWPMIDPFLEVESNSIEKVQEGLRMLELEGRDVGDKDIKVIYEEQGINIHSYVELKF